MYKRQLIRYSPLTSVDAPIAVPSSITLAPGKSIPEIESEITPIKVPCARAEEMKVEQQIKIRESIFKLFMNLDPCIYVKIQFFRHVLETFWSYALCL